MTTCNEAMQHGDPESPRLKKNFCNKMINNVNSNPQQTSLYSIIWYGEICYFIHQDANFELPALIFIIMHKFHDALGDHHIMPINQWALIIWFNGIDILQKHHEIKIENNLKLSLSLHFKVTWANQLKLKYFFEKTKMLSVTPTNQ